MFPEYRELIFKLRFESHYFSYLINVHNDIDQKIKNMESGIESVTDDEIDALKKEKLKFKDALWAILKKNAA